MIVSSLSLEACKERVNILKAREASLIQGQ